MTRKCLKVAIYDFDAKTLNIWKSGFLRKKNSTDFIFNLLEPKLQKLFSHILWFESFCIWRIQKSQLWPGEFFLRIMYFFRKIAIFDKICLKMQIFPILFNFEVKIGLQSIGFHWLIKQIGANVNFLCQNRLKLIFS